MHKHKNKHYKKISHNFMSQTELNNKDSNKMLNI